MAQPTVFDGDFNVFGAERSQVNDFEGEWPFRCLGNPCLIVHGILTSSAGSGFVEWFAGKWSAHDESAFLWLSLLARVKWIEVGSRQQRRLNFGLDRRRHPCGATQIPERSPACFRSHAPRHRPIGHIGPPGVIRPS